MVLDLATLEQETGVLASTLQLLRALDANLLNKERHLSSDELSGIQVLLVECIGNMEFNKTLDVFAHYSRLESGISSITVGLAQDISYRTRHLNKILPEIDIISERFERAKSGDDPLKSNEKISLEQYGILYDLAYLNKKLKSLAEHGLVSGNASLEMLYRQTQQAELIIKHVDDTFDTTFQTPVGSVVFDNTASKSKVYGKTLGLFERLIAFFVTKFGHASIAMSIETESSSINRLSHINPSHKNEKFSLRNFLHSDVYKIKLENLIDDSTQQMMKDKLGNDWLLQLEKKYTVIEQEIHDETRRRNPHIIADDSTKRSAEIATVWLQGGHMNFFSKNHSNRDIRDSIFGRGKWAAERQDSCKMLCSEFVGLTVIAAIQELNDLVKQELEAKGVEHIPKTLIKSPISQREKLHLLTPERLLTAMQERGVVERVTAPAELSRFVAMGADCSVKAHNDDTKGQKIGYDEPLVGIDRPIKFSQ